MRERRLRLEIRMLTDWHVGEGAGIPKYIDRLVRRDVDGLVYVPSRTLTGIWRDSCERAAAALDEATTGPHSWTDWVNVLFGDHRTVTEPMTNGQPPRASRLVVEDARFSAAVRKRLLDKSLNLHRHQVFIKPGIKIDRRTGQALDDHLHFDEMARKNAQLYAGAVVELEDDAAFETAEALLWAGTKLAERLGGKRRRGAGRCKILISGVNKKKESSLLRRLENNPSAPPELNDETRVQGRLKTTSSATAISDWVSIPLTLTLKEPVVAMTNVVGNVIETQTFIPGYFLLGPVLKQFAKGGQYLDRVARGDIRVLNAYPMSDGAGDDLGCRQRSAPVPLALAYAKSSGEQSQIENLFWPKRHDSQMKSYGRVYFSQAVDGQPQSISVHTQAVTHNVVDDQSQRPTQDIGGVYTLQSIKPNQVFMSQIQVRKDLASLFREASWPVYVGRAGRRGYGRALAKVGKPSESSATELSLCEEDTNSVIVWLRSDLLLRDPALRPAVGTGLFKTAFLDALNTALKATNDEASPEPVSIESIESFARYSRNESWHRGWGLPRPTLPAYAAGSCFKLVLSRPLTDADKAALQSLELDGLGDRRAEGFGEIAINPPVLRDPSTTYEMPKSRPTWANATSDSGETDTQTLSDLEQKFLDRVFLQGSREVLNRAVLNIVDDDRVRRKQLGFDDKKPSNSQLGRIRSRIVEMQPNHHGADFHRWLKRASDSWEWDARRSETLAKIVSDREALFDLLKKNDETGQLSRHLDNADQAMTAQLWYRSAQSLVLAGIRSEVRQRSGDGNKLTATAKD